jgi:membrane associated rhomboid family serine protease
MMMKFKANLFLLSLCTALQALCTIYPGLIEHLAFIPAYLAGWLGLLPHMVAHANWPHLLGNFSFGLPFMLYLEHRLGSKRYAMFYVLCGLGAAALMMAMEGIEVGMIGSSGAIMGVAVGACLSFGDNKPLHALGCLMAMLLIIPQLAMAPLEMLLGIAVYGHIGGALTAMLLSSRLFQPPTL